MPDPTAYVYFAIRGDFDPHAIAASIALEPDKCVKKHSHDAERQLPRTSLLDYARQETFDELVDVYTLAERVVDILEPHAPSLVAALRSCPAAAATLQVVVWFPVESSNVSTPILGFSQRVTAFMATLGAGIDIDSYRR